MANFASLSKKQAGAILKLMRDTLPESADVTIKKYGVEDAFILLRLKERFEKIEDG